jgi:hypothetical protein
MLVLNKGDFFMYKTEALKKLNAAIRLFKAMPSAHNFRMLEKAMLVYQEADLMDI